MPKLIYIFTIICFLYQLKAQEYSNDYIISNNEQTLFTISSSNKYCICNSFIGDRSKLDNLKK